MAVVNMGSTLIIANPTSHSGRGAAAAESVRRFFEVFGSVATDFDMRLSKDLDDATRIAAEAAGRDTVVAVGGDGLIHGVVNGLMKLDEAVRPRLAIVPVGSGNDFARTLSLHTNDPDRALREMFTGGERVLDLGFVCSDECPEGTYFAESLSFGLDAAIAIDTTRRREAGTRQQGERLFITSSIKLASQAHHGYPCVARIDGGEPQHLTSLIFAVLNGPTYGGGFRICPNAHPADGALDLCYNVRHPMIPHLMFLLGLARFGLHTHSRLVRLHTLHEVQVEFEGDVPCQADGEQLFGRRFEVRVMPASLRVLVPRAYSR